MDPWVRQPMDQRVRTFEPYVAKSRAPPAGVAFDPNTTALVFLHISKSGGTTVKEILSDVAKRRGWGELQLVTSRRDWTRVVEECSDPTRRAASPLCNQAFYSSTNAMGLCDFLGRRYCVYVSVLREPTSRLVSSHNYFCTLGRERRKGWQQGWTSCRWNEAQWATVMADHLALQLGVSHAPLRRVSALESAGQCADCPYLSTAPRGVDRQAVLAAAKANLASGAVRAVLLDDLAGGLHELARGLGLPELAREADGIKPLNSQTHRELDPGALALLRSPSGALAADLELYRYAQTVSA